MPDAEIPGISRSLQAGLHVLEGKIRVLLLGKHLFLDIVNHRPCVVSHPVDALLSPPLLYALRQYGPDNNLRLRQVKARRRRQCMRDGNVPELVHIFLEHRFGFRACAVRQDEIKHASFDPANESGKNRIRSWVDDAGF